MIYKMNPNYQSDGSLNPHNPINDANPRTMRNFNTFDLSYPHFLTARFGDVTPFMVAETEVQDKVPFTSFHELISPVMETKNFAEIRMIKDYFSVPYKAILPNAWDLIYVNPLHGDDVPNDANCFIAELLSKIRSLPLHWRTSGGSYPFENEDISDNFNAYWRSFRIWEMLFDDGELLSLLGCKLSKYYVNDENSIDVGAFYKDSQQVYNIMFKFLNAYFDSNEYINVRTFSSDRTFRLTSGEWNSNSSLSFRRFIEFLKTNSDSSVEFEVETDEYLLDLLCSGEYNGRLMIPDDGDIDINFSRPIAYQLAVRHFMNNDKVDNIYSAFIYRNMMASLVYKYSISEQVFDGLEFPRLEMFFNYNDSQIHYDAFSGNYLTYMFTSLYRCCDADSTFLKDYSDALNPYIYFCELLSFQKSLKYGDYFSGARLTPLAVGDVNAPVVNGNVSAIDMTRNTMVQRFLNAVNKTGRKLSEYIKAIRGGNTLPLLTDPKFLARDTSFLGKDETDNTSENQGAIVTRLISSSSKYAFEVDVEDPGIILGVVSFDAQRVYTRTIDRFFFQKDRFDMFNPYFQNIGDQEIYGAEKSAHGNGATSKPFAFTLRHMEYKQRYPIASGGFVNDLPSYAFIADNNDGEDSFHDNLSSEFIRSTNTELDRFMPSLVGFSPCQYYHFIIKFNNGMKMNRNMEYNPTIL